MMNFPILMFFPSLLILWLAAQYGACLAPAPAPERRRAGRFWRYPDRYPDAARPHHRLQFLDGHQPLRPTQELRGSRGQCDWHGICPSRTVARRRCTRRCAPSFESISSCVLCSTAPAITAKCSRSMPTPRNFRTEMWSAVQAPALAQPTPCDGPRSCRHERCVELAGIHPGGMVEPHSIVGLGVNDSDRHLL